MPEVKLVHFTGKGTSDEAYYAARLMAFTKSTRLEMNPVAFENFMSMPQAQIEAEMAYMASTIPSSWEFADLVFIVTKVSRATAQQITRTRTASFAMQSQRVTDMANVSWDKHLVAGLMVDGRFDYAMQESIDNYSEAVKRGMSLEDARDLLPIGVHCNLVAKYNFRNFVELVRARESIRVQGPYREMVAQMKEQVLDVWPWSAVFFEHPAAKAHKLIEEVALELADAGAVYKGPAGKLAKAIDLLKKDR